MHNFINKAPTIHNNKFQYNLTNFKNSKSIITIICPDHGSFFQRVDHHLSGHGCKQCADKNRVGVLSTGLFKSNPDLKDKHGSLYFIQIYNISTNESFLKVGITMSGKKVRTNTILPKKLFTVTIIEQLYGSIFDMFTFEQDILLTFNDFKFTPSVRFKGSTECLNCDIKDEVQQFILQYYECQCTKKTK
jgi:hypothetical protein